MTTVPIMWLLLPRIETSIAFTANGRLGSATSISRAKPYGAIEGAGFLRLCFGWRLTPAARRPTPARAAVLALWELR